MQFTRCLKSQERLAKDPEFPVRCKFLNRRGTRMTSIFCKLFTYLWRPMGPFTNLSCGSNHPFMNSRFAQERLQHTIGLKTSDLMSFCCSFFRCIMSVTSSGASVSAGVGPENSWAYFFCLGRPCQGLVFFLKISPLLPHSVVLMAAAIMRLVLSTRSLFFFFVTSK